MTYCKAATVTLPTTSAAPQAAAKVAATLHTCATAKNEVAAAAGITGAVTSMSPPAPAAKNMW
jgi:hypothetical protein